MGAGNEREFIDHLQRKEVGMVTDIGLEKVTIDLFIHKSQLPKYHGTEGYKMLVENILDRYANDEYFDFDMDALKDLDVKRCCRTCVHCSIEQQVCDEGGFTEIGDLDKKLTEEDCNAWERRIH